jgi:hypothetical protein
MKVEEYSRELSWDVLDIICKTLDFDDHFQFADVCKSWRAFHKIYWRTFLASQEPLLLQNAIFCDNRLFSFISIPGQKVNYSKMMKHFSNYRYLACCGGYFIMQKYNKNASLLLVINPFTRIKKVIDTPAFEDHSRGTHILLAFGKCSEEFVLVVLYKFSKSLLHVYQSRNSAWVTYSTKGIQGNVVDFAVFQNIIYVVTNTGNIGVLSLNCANIKFLKLEGTCIFTSTSSFKLVNCDEQLLVVDFTRRIIKAVYKIDFSTMSYVKLDTLGDIALFYSVDAHCYGLSDPNRWGYDSNSVYVVTHSRIGYSVYLGDKKLEKYMPLPTSHGTRNFMFDWCCTYSGDEDKLIKYITFPSPPGLGTFIYDWCFRHLRYEVDYS